MDLTGGEREQEFRVEGKGGMRGSQGVGAGRGGKRGFYLNSIENFVNNGGGQRNFVKNRKNVE